VASKDKLSKRGKARHPACGPVVRPGRHGTVGAAALPATPPPGATTAMPAPLSAAPPTPRRMAWGPCSRTTASPWAAPTCCACWARTRHAHARPSALRTAPAGSGPARCASCARAPERRAPGWPVMRAQLYDLLHWHTSLVKHYGSERSSLQAEAGKADEGARARAVAPCCPARVAG